MTKEEIARLRALCEAATGTPWRAFAADGVMWVGNPQSYSVEFDDGADAVLAAEYVNALPALLDALEARDAEVERLRALVESAYREGYDDADSNHMGRSRWMEESEGWRTSSAKEALR